MQSQEAMISPVYGTLNNRALGALAIAASPMFLLEAIFYGLERTEGDAGPAVMNLVFLSGWFCSLIALRRMRAIGTGLLGSAIFSLQVIGMTLAASQEVQNLIFHQRLDTLLYRVADIAWPSSVTFMIVTGVAVIAAKRLTGWRRFAPLLCGLTIPLGIASVILAGDTGMRVFGCLWFTFAWALLGYAVLTAKTPSESGI